MPKREDAASRAAALLHETLVAIADGLLEPQKLEQLGIAALTKRGEMPGGGAARQAAGTVRGAQGFVAREIDDSQALAEIYRLRAAGRGREAVGIVARQLAGDPRQAGAISRRLRRKLVEQNKTDTA